MKFDDSLTTEILARLVHGKSLDGLGLETKDGRILLSGLEVPKPEVLRKFKFEETALVAQAPGITIRGVTWSGLDFSGAKLNALKIHAGKLVNCRFDGSKARDWRVWSTSFSKCSFRGADLRNAALGGVENGKRCTYSDVDFTEADLRGTTYKATGFERCEFRNAVLEKLDFQTSAFVDCVFEGVLRDVLFYARGYDGDEFPANEMVNVDFSRAKLHFVGFRGLTLDRVRFPDDSDHIVIRNPADTIDRLTATLKALDDPIASKLSAFLNIGRKWIPPKQAQKVINIEDLTDTIGSEGLDLLRKLLRPQ